MKLKPGLRKLSFEKCDGRLMLAAYAADFQAVADTILRATYPTQTAGSSKSLEADGSPDAAALLRWDLSSIAKTSIVQSAALTVNVTNASAGTYELYAMTRDWTEAGATWQAAAASTP